MDKLEFEQLDKYLLDKNGKIIHQIWFGNIPNKIIAKREFEKLKKFRDSWMLKNPEYTCFIWNLKNTKMLVKTYFTQHLSTYNSYQYQIQRCDIVRYFILYRYGGWYADMDYICIRPLREVAEKFHNDIYFVETPNKLSNITHISNSLMFSRPKHNFWKRLFIELEINKTMPYYYGRHMEIMFTTGPGILNRVYNTYKLRDHLDYLPYKLFHPFGLSDDIVKYSCDSDNEIYAIHAGKGSWEGSDSKIIIFAYQEYKILLYIFMVFILPQLFINLKLSPTDE